MKTPSLLAKAIFAIVFLLPVWCQDFGTDAQRQEQVLFSGQLQVAAGQRRVLPFSTRSNFRNARIAGNIQAKGGSGDDIRVIVMKGQSVIFDSGQRRSVVLSVDFSDPGQYALIFDNGFSLLSPKLIAGKISLVHSGIDIARDANDRQLAAGRFNQATLVVERLYRALKAGERVWGTSQLSGLPNIRMNNDRTINAAANWSTNSLYINRGLFDLVEKVGTKGEDVLAATLAHELGHIFYHHPGYGSGQGVKGLFDELRGVTALDRIQEKEADFLGLRLTCQAGFDPQGMLILMKTFAAMDNGAGSFARNHPSGAERFNYLLEEAMKCQTLQSEKRPSSRPNDVQQVSTQNAPVSSRPDLTTGGEPLWKLAQNPNSHWKFKFGESFLYGERLMPDERRQRGEFDNVDVKKQGSIFVGTQHMRVALKIKDDSRQGFHYKSCQWDFAVELTEVSRERLEGRWEGYSKDSKINPLTCVRSGERIWEDVAWILE